MIGLQRLVLIGIVIGALAACSAEQHHAVSSPDGEIIAEVWLDDAGSPAYRISRGNRVVLKESRLGLVSDRVGLSSSLTLITAGEAELVDEPYEMIQGKKRERRYLANQKVFRFASESGELLEIVFRVSNDGAGIQYRLPGQNTSSVTLQEEETFFTLPADSKAWLTPMAVVNTGWSETNPSYEEYYSIGVDAGTPSTLGVGWSYPALFQTPENDWLLITESGMDGTYPGTRLRTESEDGVYRVGYPAEEEVVTGGIRGPEFETPWRSPWRVIAVGDLETIVESTLGTDLATPSTYDDTSYIAAGRASWSWAKLKDASVNYDRQIEFIDYAADMGWEYTLIDVNWDQTIGYERIEELVDYADEKGVGIWLWYNSSGDWNSSPYTPKSALLTTADRISEFSRLQEIGVRGIKVDFFPGDGQSALQYYIDIFTDAHDHQLMVNTHGSTIPRGWHRTYPNLMTMEAVRGFEFKTFEQVNQNEAPSHATVLPFTRNVFDPMDYTPMSLDEIPGIERVTTSMQELAHSILFLSGVQHFAETPAGMTTVPEYIKESVKGIPAAWDETQFVDGFPGEFVIIARRSGDSWFVAGINGEGADKSVDFQLPFLQEQAQGVLLEDGEDRFSFNSRQLNTAPGDTHTVVMQPNGGFVMILE
jgi:hypothetical protein